MRTEDVLRPASGLIWLAILAVAALITSACGAALDSAIETEPATPSVTEQQSSSTTESENTTTTDSTVGDTTTTATVKRTAKDTPTTTTEDTTTTTSDDTTTTSDTTTTTTGRDTTTTDDRPKPIKIVSGPTVNVRKQTSFQFNYTTNDVCGTGSFTVRKTSTGVSAGSFRGKDICFGPLHGGYPGLAGNTDFGHIVLEPGTTYTVSVTVRGTASDGTRTAGSGTASASFSVTTAGAAPPKDVGQFNIDPIGGNWEAGEGPYFVAVAVTSGGPVTLSASNSCSRDSAYDEGNNRAIRVSGAGTCSLVASQEETDTHAPGQSRTATVATVDTPVEPPDPCDSDHPNYPYDCNPCSTEHPNYPYDCDPCSTEHPNYPYDCDPCSTEHPDYPQSCDYYDPPSVTPPEDPINPGPIDPDPISSAGHGDSPPPSSSGLEVVVR